MKKENKTQKTEFSIGKINRIISKINKTGLIVIIACYILILSFALSLVGKDISYISEPDYEHQFYNTEITPQITLTGVYDFEEGHAHAHAKYNVNVNIAGRQIDSKDPNYKISSFRMFSTVKDNLTSEKPNSTHYFTEHTTYTTPITHTYTVDSSHEEKHPSTFYVRLQYEDNDVTKVETFKENVFLVPTADDKDGMDDWYNLNSDTAPSAANILGSKDLNSPVGIFEAQSFMDTDEDGKETGIYKAGVRISLNETVSKKFHVDMQSWIVTKEGEYLPFIGVYNYTGPSKKFTKSLIDINEELQPEFIVAKVVFRDENNKTEYVSYFKQEIKKINSSFVTNQQPGLDVDAGTITKNDRGLYIALTIISSVVLVGAVVAGSYLFLKKKEN